MSEMLGNHYYMTRNYIYACTELEEVIVFEPENYVAAKKLLICYLKMKSFSMGWELYYRIIDNAPQVILEQNINTMDCPCREVLQELQPSESYVFTEWTFPATLAILWSFFNKEKALYYFQIAGEMNPKQTKITNIISQLKLIK